MRDVPGLRGSTGGADEIRTLVVLEITHRKQLPADAASQIAQRAYSFCYARGCEVGVTAKVLEQKGEA
jgi:hypothetical protein